MVAGNGQMQRVASTQSRFVPSDELRRKLEVGGIWQQDVEGFGGNFDELPICIQSRFGIESTHADLSGKR